MRKDLPPRVFRDLQDYLREGCARGEEGWESGSDEEDTLTGDLGGSLRCPWQELGGEAGKRWRFRVTYKKFRGRGRGADESIFGADGILEVQIEDRHTSTKHGKGVLFQAKKKGDSRKRKLLEQASRMERIAQNGSAIFEYGPNEYAAFDASELGGGRRLPVGGESWARLGDYLADRFLPCDVGKRGMFFDAVGRAIVYTDDTGDVIRARATMKHRLRIEVESEQG
jgi:hypothetical protein